MFKCNAGRSWGLGGAYFESLVGEIIRLFESIVTKVKEKILLQNNELVSSMEGRKGRSSLLMWGLPKQPVDRNEGFH